MIIDCSLLAMHDQSLVHTNEKRTIQLTNSVELHLWSFKTRMIYKQAFRHENTCRACKEATIVASASHDRKATSLALTLRSRFYFNRENTRAVKPSKTTFTRDQASSVKSNTRVFNIWFLLLFFGPYYPLSTKAMKRVTQNFPGRG